jgi:hypothetical protein
MIESSPFSIVRRTVMIDFHTSEASLPISDRSSFQHDSDITNSDAVMVSVARENDRFRVMRYGMIMVSTMTVPK